MAEIIEYIFTDNMGGIYLIESSEIYQKGDKIYEKNFNKELILA